MSGSAHHFQILLHQAAQALGEGAFDSAEASYRQIIAALPSHPEANHNLSLILAQTGRVREAERRMEKQVKSAPNDVAAHLLLGRILLAEGNSKRGGFLVRRAVTLLPDNAELALDAIALLGQAKLPNDAAEIAKSAAARHPKRADLPLQAGLVWVNNGEDGRAKPWFEQALAVDPAFAPALFQLAGIAETEKRFGDALRLYRRAQANDPQRRLTPICLGDLQLRLGDVDAAIDSVEAWLAERPTDPVALSNRLMAAQYAPGVTVDGLRHLHQRWEDAIGASLRAAWQPHPNSKDPERRLRVGLVSADFRAHPVGYFTLPGLENIDAERFEIACYSDAVHGDEITARFRQCAALWRDIAGLDDAGLAARIRDDRVDILIDLAGQTTGTRLAAFARKPAPVQLSWAGYFGTTGAAAIDGLIVDPTLIRPGEERLYREAIWRMPQGYLCYDPPSDAPEVAPRADAGTLILAAFHNPAKINRELVALWSRLLLALAPRAVELRLTYAGYDDPDVAARLLGWFAEHGISPAQIRFSGALPRAAYFAAMGACEIALDPFPYSGGAITMDALWMGVPTITLPGETVASRHSATHLHAAGLDEFIATSPDDYVGLVMALADDSARLAEIRAGLRGRVAASPICDAPRFGESLGTLLRTAWRHWCAG